jgi:hypothetical protein
MIRAAALLECNAVGVAEQHDVAGVADDGVQPIEFTLSDAYERLSRVPRVSQLGGSQNMWRGLRARIDMMVVGAPTPRRSDLFDLTITQSFIGDRYRFGDAQSGVARAFDRVKL